MLSASYSRPHTLTQLPASQRRVLTGSSSVKRATQSNAVAADFTGLARLEREGHQITSPKGWDKMRDALRLYQVGFIQPHELAQVQQSPDVVVVDVRPAPEFGADHLHGSINVPFYQPITGWSPFKIVRRMGFAFFGILNGTEVNPDFVKNVRAVIGAKKEVIVVCTIGGAMEEGEGVGSRGRQSRSLIAAFEIFESVGGVKVKVLKGGFQAWAKAGRESSASI